MKLRAKQLAKDIKRKLAKRKTSVKNFPQKKQKNVLKPCKYIIPQPAKNIFKYTHGRVETIQDEIKNSMEIERIDGTDIYIKGAEYPRRGFPTPDSIWSANQAKILFVEGLKLSPYLLFANKEKLLIIYNKIAMRAIKPFLLKRIYLAPSARELGDIVFTFLIEIGISHNTAKDFAEIVSYIIDIDNAYRLRLQDICSETNKMNLMRRPIREIKRLLSIYEGREEGSSISEKERVAQNFKNVSKLMSLFLLVPKYRKAFKRALLMSSFKDLQYNEADNYWVLFEGGYKYLGLDLDSRQKILRKIYKKIPIFYNVTI